MITVTLTTDWGTDGLYGGAFKGKLVQRIPGVQLIDITHTVPPLNPIYAVYALQNAYTFFAKKTIHIVGVGGIIGSNTDTSKREYICFQHNYHYFIGPNNGMWEMMFGEIPSDVFLLDAQQLSEQFVAFPELDIYIDAIAKLALGNEPKHLGPKTQCNLGRLVPLPARKANQLLGVFQYFDVYGNGITNITKQEFYDTAKGREFVIMVGTERNEFVVDFIAKDYSEGDSSKILALFSYTGFLEICVPFSKLTNFLHIDKNTKILVNFFDEDEAGNQQNEYKETLF